MHDLSAAELCQVSGGKKLKTTPVGPSKKAPPVEAAHGLETAALASNKPKKVR
jgi:hypothetical protein